MTEREMARKKAAARKARQARERKQRTRRVALTVCLMMAVCVASIGGTIAWLQASTTPVVNTFTPSDIKIKLEEEGAQYDENDKAYEQSFKMVPGATIEKKPKVTVEAGSEACWVFVKIEKKNGFDTYMQYTVAEGWTALTGYDGVYYREQADLTAADAANAVYSVLKDDKVTVLDTVTKENMNALTAGNYPTLTFKAAAVQKANINAVADAFDKVKADLGYTTTTGA